ncbi:MAG: GTP-binding protein [Bacilli bacterium]|nr:GTP-binding protein [Bacilli bacterium]
MNKVVIGILAHVDAGKTTLSEALLYLSGKIKSIGRVDNKDAYLDTYALEKERGITIFAKQAVFNIDNLEVTLLDTPGHVDFSSEMERTLPLLDYAILVISAADGIQTHTKTLWMLLETYNIPTFIFINKMDQYGTDKDKLIKELKEQLNHGCIDFNNINQNSFFEEIAMCDEEVLDSYLYSGYIDQVVIKSLLIERKVFPCFFGSALKLEGVEEFIKGLRDLIIPPLYPTDFGAKIFKITRDENNNRLTHMKITGGRLKVKDTLTHDNWEEKINQIRIYSGNKYEVVGEVTAGSVCAVTGLSKALPGEGLGIEEANYLPLLEPVLVYRLVLPEGCDPRVILPKLKQLEEEEPELKITWNEQLEEIQLRVMGEMQLEILQRLILDRFGVEVGFTDGGIIYKETIANIVEGVGHFEPLGHYAEVHLLLEPGERGTGIVIENKCSEDTLSGNFQRLILQHLSEKVHKGVLTGSDIIDIKITLVSGRAHKKHTSGGDFREATYRALRQGLMETVSILLEPYYSIRLELPENMVGRALTDINLMGGTCQITDKTNDMVIIEGVAPVRTMRNYHKDVIAYTKGLGRLYQSLVGYFPSNDSQKIITEIGYNPLTDFDNPSYSIFCANGTSYTVPWYEVKNHMHLESYLQNQSKIAKDREEILKKQEERFISQEEIERIIQKTLFANKGDKSKWKRHSIKVSSKEDTPKIHYEDQPKEECLLVDGYNVIHAWPELKELSKINMDAARLQLLDNLSNYRGVKKCRIIVVFDAYRVANHQEEISKYKNIYVVYTKEAQTADEYIEKFAFSNRKKYNITVATSDALEQLIVRGQGSKLLSARELKLEIERVNEMLKRKYINVQDSNRNTLIKTLSPSLKPKLYRIIQKNQIN